MLLVRDEERWVAQLDKDGGYVVSEGWEAKLERDVWLSWIGMVTMLLVRDGW